MEGMVKGLFGGGDGDQDQDKVSRAQDFARRYTEGDPSTGYEEDEALQHFNDVIGGANADEVEQATRQTLEGLPASDRAQFGDFVGQLQQRDPRDSGGSMGVDDISKLFGQHGGRASNAQDMFGGLFGGGGQAGGGGGGGIGGMLGGLMGGGGGGMMGGGSSGGLGGLLGGGGGGRSGGGMGGMLGGSMGKMILGGIASYLIKNKLR